MFHNVLAQRRTSRAVARQGLQNFWTSSSFLYSLDEMIVELTFENMFARRRTNSAIARHRPIFFFCDTSVHHYISYVK